MKDIGKQLKDKRLQLNLSYDDITKITKMPEEQIRAMEAGDISYFEHDLTYLRFYVRKYCNVLGLSFDSYREDLDTSVDQYTESISLQAIREREAIEEHISSRKEIKKADTYKEPPASTKKDRQSIRQNRNVGKRKRKSFDFSLISLLLIIVVVIGIIVYVGVKFGTGRPTSDNTPKIPENKEVTPVPEKSEKEKEEEKQKEEKQETKITFETVSPTEYIVHGVKVNDPLVVDITFTQPSWVQDTLNNPGFFKEAVYGPDTPIRYNGVTQANSAFAIRFGNFNKDQVSVVINGTKLEFDPQISTLGNVLTLKFTVKGE